MEFRRLEHFSASGWDEAQFIISTNPGQPMRPLKDVASGGELSRIMLAIKTVLADSDDIPTLIFDEIDTGISGRTAQKVSEKLSYIAGSLLGGAESTDTVRKNAAEMKELADRTK